MRKTPEQLAEIRRLNGRLGGRPKGSRSAKTLERDKILMRIRQRTMQVADVLFDSQLSTARGLSFLYKIEKKWVKTGKNTGYFRNEKPVLVTDQEEIQMYLEKRVEEGDMDDDQDSGDTYYFITTKEPNNQAIDSMYDRTFGRSKQGDLDVNVKLPKPLLDNMRHKK